MKIILSTFIALALLLPYQTKAQACKWDVEKQDKISLDTLRSKTFPIGPQSYNWKLIMEQKGNKYYLCLAIKWGGQLKTPIKSGQKIIFNLDGDHKVVFLSNRDYTPNYAVDKHGETITTYFPKGEINKEQLMLLANFPVNRVHLKLDNDVIEVNKFSENQIDLIQQFVSCILALSRS